MRNLWRRSLVCLLAAALLLPGSMALAEESTDPPEQNPAVQAEETVEPQKEPTVQAQGSQKEPVTIVAYWAGSSEEAWKLDDGTEDSDDASAVPEENTADPGESNAGEEGTGNGFDEDDIAVDDTSVDPDPEDGSAEEDMDNADPEADEPEDLSDGVSADAEAKEADRVVVVTSSLDGLDEVEENTEAVLTAVFYGFSEDDDYSIQWQYSPDGGNTVYDAEDGTEPEYRYTITKETIHYAWRVVVTLAEEETQQDPETEDADTQE
ncbi:MAG: hypothetical protein IJX90_08720 [Blautia sp.]|nr:hypothetical protein [Blautia sp.]